MAKERIKKMNNILLGVMILQIMILPLATAQEIGASVSSTKIGEDQIITGNFNKITSIDNTNSKTKSEKIGLLATTNVNIPIQGKVSYLNAPYNGAVQVCIADAATSTCNSNVIVTNGTFYANILNVPIEDPHSVHILTINVNGTQVVNEEFYPAGAPQGDLTVNGKLMVTGAGITLGNIDAPGSIKYDNGDFYGYTNAWQSLTSGGGSESGLWINQGSYIYPTIFDTLTITNSGLGIGVTNPLAPLHVNGSAIFAGDALPPYSSGELIYSPSGNYYQYYNSTDWVLFGNGAINYNGTLWTRNGTTIYYIDGYVGIGTDNPQESLDVNGTIQASVDVCIDGGRCLSAGPEAPVFAGVTNSSYSGFITFNLLTGYQAANAICGNEYSSSHMCTQDEVLKIIAYSGPPSYSGNAWLQKGSPGYTADANDCVGWTSNSNQKLAAYWRFADNYGIMINCQTQLPLACCR